MWWRSWIGTCPWMRCRLKFVWWIRLLVAGDYVFAWMLAFAFAAVVFVDVFEVVASVFDAAAAAFDLLDAVGSL